MNAEFTVRGRIVSGKRPAIPICIGLLLLVYASIAPTPVRAAEPCFEYAPPATGKQAAWNEDPACEEILANVNEFCGRRLLACEFKVSPKHPAITLPRWQRLPPASSQDLIETLVKAGALASGAPGDLSRPQRDWPYYKDWVEDTLRRGVLRIEQSDVPLSDPTKPERVYRLRFGNCGDTFEARGNAGGKPLSFINLGPSVYSERLRRWYLSYEDSRKRGATAGPPSENGWTSPFFAEVVDPFIYRQQTWLFRRESTGTIYIDSASRGAGTMCAFVPR